MKILIISNYFPPEIGAASSRIFNLAKNLKSHYERVEVICPFPNYPTGKIIGNYKGLYKSEIIKGVKCHKTFIYPDNSKNPIKRFLSMSSFALSIWIFVLKKKFFHFDLIIIQNSPLLVSFSSIILFKKILGKKIILNISDLWPQSAVDLGAMTVNSISYKIFRKIERFNYYNSDKIIGQSKYILNHILQLYDKPNFHYKNLPQIDFKNIKYFKSFGKIKFIYAGLLGVAQGLLEIVKIMQNLNLDFEFDLYGDGSQKNEIEKYLNYSKSNNIKYHGSISKLELQKILCNYDYSLVPLVSDIKGAFPSKIYELIIHRIPVIYIGEGEAREFIESKNLGYCLSPSKLKEMPNLIEYIIKNHKYNYNKQIENCKRISVKELNFDQQFIKLLNFLKDD